MDPLRNRRQGQNTGMTVSPARAGMDRPGLALGLLGGRVSPARAGMDPGVRKRDFPDLTGQFPPHARGWTVGSVDLVHRTRARRFPPHARGWTRLAERGLSTDQCEGFPRTRGDGPREP